MSSRPVPPESSISTYTVDDNVVKSFPILGTKMLGTQNYAESLWKKTIKITVQLPSGERDNYFLKVDGTGLNMCEGEYESLKEIYSFSPSFVPRPYGWGTCLQKESTTEMHFLLTEFREIGEKVCLLRGCVPEILRCCPSEKLEIRGRS